MEFAGGAHGVLADHGVGDEQDFAGLELAFEEAEFVHQLFVDVQAAGSVHQDHVGGGKLGFADGALGDFERLVRAGAGPAAHSYGFGDLCELFPGGGAVDVGGDNQGAVAVAGQPFRELAGGGGFAGALKADDHPDGRRPRSEGGLGMFAEQFQQLVADDLEDLLIGRELQQDFRAKRFGANVGQEFVGDVHVDVAIEEGFADANQGGVHVLVGELALAAQVLEDALEFLGKIFKHCSGLGLELDLRLAWVKQLSFDSRVDSRRRLGRGQFERACAPKTWCRRQALWNHGVA